MNDERLGVLSGMFQAVIPAQERHSRPDRGQESILMLFGHRRAMDVFLLSC